MLLVAFLFSREVLLMQTDYKVAVLVFLGFAVVTLNQTSQSNRLTISRAHFPTAVNRPSACNAFIQNAKIFQQPRVLRVLNLWQKNNVFPQDIVQQLMVMGGAPTPGDVPATTQPQLVAAAQPAASVTTSTSAAAAAADPTQVLNFELDLCVRKRFSVFFSFLFEAIPFSVKQFKRQVENAE